MALTAGIRAPRASGRSRWLTSTLLELLGDVSIEAAEAAPFAAPTALGGGATVTLHVFVPDVDNLAERTAIA